MRIQAYLFIFLISILKSYAQTSAIYGKVSNPSGEAISSASISISKSGLNTLTNTSGYYNFNNLNFGKVILKASAIGYQPAFFSITLSQNMVDTVNFELLAKEVNSLNDVVVTGTLKEVRRLESPVPVEVFTPAFFKKNPTANIYEALQNVNGVRPQLNCNVCNTGDIHINGLEGPYTMILIDGMPIVSSLSTVYGLSGIPNSLIERVEIVKGPASSLYGSEAVGGLINIITKKPQNAPIFSADIFSTSWQEVNTDIGFKFNAGKKASVLTGLNYFKYGNRIDNNQDNFTDITLQDRISVFQKWNLERKESRVLTFAGRYNYEDRWGGDMNWTPNNRGGDEVYAESIFTKRWEFIGNYQLPIKEKMMFSFSYNNHNQNSVYGNIPYLAKQEVAFSQLTWDKKVGTHDLLAGTALRYTFYDDNTPATANADINNPLNRPENTYLPGVFLQDEISLSKKQKLLLGFRFDYNSNHGNIFTPRLAYKLSINEKNILRFNAGTGFRVVNLFTEDHAALTGAREVEINENLQPEKSYNANINYIKKIYTESGNSIVLDGSIFYTYFNNRIIGDFDSDPNKIIYDNLNGNAVSRGVSLNVDATLLNGLKILAGASLLDVFTKEEDVFGNNLKIRPILNEKWTGTWAISYKLNRLNLGIDYTGNIYGPMRLPLLSNTDPRSEFSPVWSTQNLQLTLAISKKYEIYGGVKNLLNFTPGKKDPFLIARSRDPFDKNVQFDNDGNVMATPDNPYALTFDPSFVYAPNQGIRGFLGVRLAIN